jgi:hypothetical protein
LANIVDLDAGLLGSLPRLAEKELREVDGRNLDSAPGEGDRMSSRPAGEVQHGCRPKSDQLQNLLDLLLCDHEALLGKDDRIRRGPEVLVLEPRGHR